MSKNKILPLKANAFTFVLLAALALPVLICTGCPDVLDDSLSEQSAVPAGEAAALSIAKTTASQKSVSFTLTSTHTGEWKVYGAETDAAPLTTAAASFSTPVLTLSAAGDDLPAGNYWVSVTEAGKTESPRLGLTVGPYVPPESGAPAGEAAALIAAKTTASQKSVSFTLTSTHTGEWKVYGAETDAAPLTTAAASFSTPVLTLSAAGDDLPAGNYWVSVTEAGKTESPRLGLTVEKYLPAVFTLGVEGAAITAKVDTGTGYTVTGSGGTAVAEVNGYPVINFAAGADNIDLVQTPAREYLPRNAWTMEMYVKINSGGSGNVDFLQFWTTRNEAPTFRIELPNWLFITHALDATKRIGAAQFTDAWRHIAIVKSGNSLTAYVNGVQQNASDGYGNFNSAAFNEVTTSSIGTSGAGGQLYKYSIHNSALEPSAFSGVQTVVDALNTITITFDANGGSFSEAGNPTKTVNILRPANTAALPEQSPVNGEKIFAGWFTAPEGGTSFTSSTPVTANTTVYAAWSDAPVVYNVTFDAYFGAFGDSATKVVPVTSPETVGDAMPGNPTLTGFTFSGWYTKKSDEDWGDPFTGSSAVTADTTVYAKWVWDDSLGITSITYAVNPAGTLEGALSGGSTPKTIAPVLKTGSGTVEEVNGLKVSSGSRYDFGPHAGVFLSKTDWTLEFYVHSTSTSTGASPNPLLFSRLDDNKNNGGIWIENYNWYFVVRTAASGSTRTQTAANNTANTWYHMAYVKSGASITVYKNGDALALGSNPNFNMLETNAYFKALFHNYFGASYLKFYKFALYSRAWDTTDFAAVTATLNTLNGVSGD